VNVKVKRESLSLSLQKDDPLTVGAVSNYHLGRCKQQNVLKHSILSKNFNWGYVEMLMTDDEHRP